VDRPRHPRRSPKKPAGRRLAQVLATVSVVGLGLAGSTATGPVAAAAAAAGTPPANVSPPAISGFAVIGRTLSVSTGSWKGDSPIAFSYAWQRCDSSGGACTTIVGATSQTYTIVSADVGHTLRADVTASNDAGTGSQLSSATATVSAGPPVDTVSPTVSGTLAIGDTLTVTPGTWTGAQPISISFRWERCDTGGGSCNWISGATGASYKVTTADAGHRLIVVVTATNSAGSKTAVVTAGNLAGGVAVNTVVPKVSGTVAIGDTLTVSPGSWSGTQPITVSYQWDRCDTNGGDCATINGATAASYKIAAADAVHRLVVVVTGKNSIGSNHVVVTAGNVSGGPPIDTTAPKVSGTVAVGNTVTVSGGSWSGTQPIAVSYRWERCDSNGGNCSWINGATAADYRITTADAGHRLIVEVTAKNAYGSQQAVVTAGNIGGSGAGGAVLVGTVNLPDRLVIDRVKFSPNPARARTPILARFHVSDGSGRSVSGALVYALGLPYGWTYHTPEQATDATGWATLTIRPTRTMPLRRGALVMFVRARKPGDSLLAGVSTRRLVQENIR